MTIQASLIMSTYNRVDALELTLMSALQQSTLPNEILVADDGSREETRALIEKYKKVSPVPLVHVWHPDEGFQLAKIRNKAVAQSKYEYVVSIDADQVLHKSFIADHLAVARRGVFLQGHRVLLSKELTEKALKAQQLNFSVFEKGLTNHKNALHVPFLRDLLSKPHRRLKGVRGCNMSFWKEDLKKVNAFNEAFVGWGREDSELVLRLFNSNIERVDLYFSAIAYHLHHPENSKNNLSANDLELERTLKEKRVFCEKGLNQYDT